MYNQLFIFAVKNRVRIIGIFKFFYLILGVLLIVGSWSVYTQNAQYPFFYTLALWMGRVAILLYITTLIPGICRRFGIQHRLPQIIMMFRRYIGITTFLFVFIHFWWIRGMDVFLKGAPLLPMPLFMLAAGIAICGLAAMFLTSNDFSVARLGKWWKRIHSVTYVVVFLILAHVALQRMSIWTYIIGAAALLQALSWIVYFIRQKAISATQEQQTNVTSSQ